MHRPKHFAVKGLLAVVLAIAAGGAALAHHFLVASYRLDQTVTIEGPVAEFLLRNPHSFVQVEVRDRAGRVEIRTVEWGSGGQLGRAGVDQDTFRRGERVKITANPSRNAAERKLRMVSIVRLRDGWRWDGSQ